MKRFYFALLGMAFISSPEQTNAQKGFSLSVLSTPQVSFLRNSDDNKNNNLDRVATFNGAFGAGVDYQFNSQTGVGLDVFYSLQGQRSEIMGMQTNQRQNLLKIPVYFLYTSNASRPVSFLGKIGPQVSFLLSSKTINAGSSNSDVDTEGRYKGASFGGMIGVGAQFRLSPRCFLTALPRFDYDFTNAEDDGNAYWPASRAKTHNMTAGLEVGFKLKLK